jgi:tetratricopeptide (TPR) repeat protein
MQTSSSLKLSLNVLDQARDFHMDAKTPEALKILGELLPSLSSLPEQAECLIAIADILMDLNKPTQAIELAEQALVRVPNSAEFLLKLSEYFKKTGNYPKAKETIQKMISGDPENAELWGRAAEICLLEGNTLWADTCLKKALEYDDDCIEALKVMADYYEHTGKFHDAENIYFHLIYKAVRDSEPCPDAALGMARCLLRRGEIPLALHHLSQRHYSGAKERELYPQLMNLKHLNTLEGISGKILIASEQDALFQFRFLNLLSSLIADSNLLMIEVHVSLIPLVQEMFPKATVFPEAKRQVYGQDEHNYPEDLINQLKGFSFVGDAFQLMDSPKIPLSRRNLLKYDKNYFLRPLFKQSHAKKIGVILSADILKWAEPAFENQNCTFIPLGFSFLSPHVPLSDVCGHELFQNTLKKNLDFHELKDFFSCFDGWIMEPSLMQEIAQALDIHLLQISLETYLWNLGEIERSAWSSSTSLSPYKVEETDSMKQQNLQSNISKFINELN